MAVAIDKARRDDGVICIDHLGVGRIERRRNGGDLLAFDQHVALHKVADLGIHADDGAALEQDAMVGIDGGLALETERVFCRSDIGKPAASGRAGRQCGASLQGTTSGDGHVFFHGEFLVPDFVNYLYDGLQPEANLARISQDCDHL